ncbi:hypothetical protein RHMOL_Rhmol01G0033900 [Rhododendron molle]|uniref:Uncharacterized protein n=1 Tax=Rhododendron molle TaxID=49168 RepID=A0ACC0PXN9_RHOML|nr:hypothetical protein RHMOL_Rhmol01G0033900 [Rhododendron molle]
MGQEACKTVSDTQITQQIVDIESTTMGEVNLINVWLPIPSSVSKGIQLHCPWGRQVSTRTHGMLTPKPSF